MRVTAAQIALKILEGNSHVMLHKKIQKAAYYKKQSNQQTIPAKFALSFCSMNMDIPLQLAVPILNTWN
jgi:hypothetical protein